MHNQQMICHLKRIMPQPVENGALSVAFVCPSVCPSVAYIANNSRTQRPSMPKFGTKIPHLWCDLHTSFKVKRSKVKVTRPINGDISSTSSEWQGLRTSNLIYGWRTMTGISHMCHDLQGQRSRDQSELSWPNAVPVSSEAGGGIPCRPNPAATLLVISS